jgi:hypothetical protein
MCGDKPDGALKYNGVECHSLHGMNRLGRHVDDAEVLLLYPLWDEPKLKK